MWKIKKKTFFSNTQFQLKIIKNKLTFIFLIIKVIFQQNFLTLKKVWSEISQFLMIIKKIYIQFLKLIFTWEKK